MRIRKTKHSKSYDYIVGFFWDKKNRNFYISLWRLCWVIEFPQRYIGFKLEVPVVPFSSQDIEDIKKEFEKPSKIVLVPKEELTRIQHTSLCGPIDAHEINYAKKQGIILHGWTGKRCEPCNGRGERKSINPRYFGETLKCEDCGGTGDEYGELKAK